MKLVFAVLALLCSSTASARLPCMGQPIREANLLWAANELIVGTQPTEKRATTCGGSLDAEGNRIRRFPCFVQTWAVRNSETGETGTLLVIYSKPDDRTGPWKVNNASVCSDGTCEPLDLSYCPGTEGAGVTSYGGI